MDTDKLKYRIRAKQLMREEAYITISAKDPETALAAVRAIEIDSLPWEHTYYCPGPIYEIVSVE